MSRTADPIDGYLREVRRALRRRPLARRRILAEIEEHLRAATASAVGAGADPLEAAREAVERFGRPAVVARGFVEGPSPLGRQLRVFVAAGLVAVAVLVGVNRHQVPTPAQAHPNVATTPAAQPGGGR